MAAQLIGSALVVWRRDGVSTSSWMISQMCSASRIGSEGEALVLFLRWLLQFKSHRSTRVVVLLDSAALLAAAAIGRSSSLLNRLLRKVVALALAGSIHPRLLFVPSSENPADLPSRGRRRGHKRYAAKA